MNVELEGTSLEKESSWEEDDMIPRETNGLNREMAVRRESMGKLRCAWVAN